MRLVGAIESEHDRHHPPCMEEWGRHGRGVLGMAKVLTSTLPSQMKDGSTESGSMPGCHMARYQLGTWHAKSSTLGMLLSSTLNPINPHSSILFSYKRS